jgi:hypothetical protein
MQRRAKRLSSLQRPFGRVGSPCLDGHLQTGDLPIDLSCPRARSGSRLLGWSRCRQFGRSRVASHADARRAGVSSGCCELMVQRGMHVGNLDFCVGHDGVRCVEVEVMPTLALMNPSRMMICVSVSMKPPIHRSIAPSH